MSEKPQPTYHIEQILELLKQNNTVKAMQEFLKVGTILENFDEKNPDLRGKYPANLKVLFTMAIYAHELPLITAIVNLVENDSTIQGSVKTSTIQSMLTTISNIYGAKDYKSITAVEGNASNPLMLAVTYADQDIVQFLLDQYKKYNGLKKTQEFISNCALSSFTILERAVELNKLDSINYLLTQKVPVSDKVLFNMLYNKEELGADALTILLEKADDFLEKIPNLDAIWSTDDNILTLACHEWATSDPMRPELKEYYAALLRKIMPYMHTKMKADTVCYFLTTFDLEKFNKILEDKELKEYFSVDNIAKLMKNDKYSEEDKRKICEAWISLLNYAEDSNNKQEQQMSEQAMRYVQQQKAQYDKLYEGFISHGETEYVNAKMLQAFQKYNAQQAQQLARSRAIRVAPTNKRPPTASSRSASRPITSANDDIRRTSNRGSRHK